MATVVQHKEDCLFEYFEDLPDLVQRAVFRKLDLKSAAALSLCNRELLDLGKDAVWRNYGCSKCGCCFFHPRDVQDIPKDVFMDGPVFFVSKLTGVELKPRTICSDYSFIYSLVRHVTIMPAFSIIIQPILCSQCQVFVGIKVVDIVIRRQIAGLFQGAEGTLLYKLKEQLLEMYLMPQRYLSRLPNPGYMDDTREKSAEFRCTAARSSKLKLGECNALLFRECDVLSEEHRWDAGDGTEGAFYVNLLEPGSFYLGPERDEVLCQGEMVVADAFCAHCKGQIGWKFCTDLEGSNLCQVGRFGVVKSSFQLPGDDQPHGGA